MLCSRDRQAFGVACDGAGLIPAMAVLKNPVMTFTQDELDADIPVGLAKARRGSAIKFTVDELQADLPERRRVDDTPEVTKPEHLLELKCAEHFDLTAHDHEDAVHICDYVPVI